MFSCRAVHAPLLGHSTARDRRFRYKNVYEKCAQRTHMVVFNVPHPKSPSSENLQEWPSSENALESPMSRIFTPAQWSTEDPLELPSSCTAEILVGQQYAVDIQLENLDFWTSKMACMTNRSENEFLLQFIAFSHDFWFWHFQVAHGRPFSIMPHLLRERIDRERAGELTILDWVVSLCEVQETTGKIFLVKNPMGATSWNQPSIQRHRIALFVIENMSHLCMFGVKDPRSRRALKRPIRYLTNRRESVEMCRAKMCEQTCSQTGERTHECVSELFSLARACLETSCDQGSGERRCQKTRGLFSRRCGNGASRYGHTWWRVPRGTTPRRGKSSWRDTQWCKIGGHANSQESGAFQ